MICPVCGGQVVRVDLSASGAGEVHYSGCCQIGLELLDNFEVIDGLPEPYRQQAIADSRAVFVAWQQRNLEEIEQGTSQRERACEILRELAKEARYAY
jgi:hypothetical protein